MNGLQIAQRYFNEWGLPYLRSEFPQLSERVAAFIFGFSQSLGNDDELSRDHAWGPGFEIVLTGEDMRRFGRKLRRSIQADAPRTWLGVRWHPAPNVYSVDSINRWFSREIGCATPPKSGKEWLKRTKAVHLYMLRHMTTFHDPLGEFSARRKAFWYYPKDAWVTRIRDETFQVWHHGQYNFSRTAKRKDPIAIAACLGNFIERTMTVYLLLSKDYAPYWKWLSAEFRKLPDTGEVVEALEELTTSKSRRKQGVLVDFICDDLHSRLLKSKLITGKRSGHPHSLYDASNELEALASKLERNGG